MIGLLLLGTTIDLDSNMMNNSNQESAIRPEAAADVAEVYALTEAAFKHMPYAGGDEQDVVDRLRAAGALAVSLVAEREGEIVGHVAFSPVDAADASGPWFALGPVSVRPEYQKAGIGSLLINEGLVRTKELGALGCILVGDPAYYQRFGFELSPGNSPQQDYEEFFMMKLFSDVQPTGAMQFHPAFYG